MPSWWPSFARARATIDAGSAPDLERVLPELQEYAISQAETATREDFCRIFLEKIGAAAGARWGTVAVWEEDSSQLRPVARLGPSRPLSQAAQRAFKTGEAVLERTDGGNLCAVPLRALSRSFGTLELELGSAPAPALERRLSLFAGEAAAVLHQLRLFENLQGFHIEMVETLYGMLHARDPQTGDKAEATRERARRLAQALKLPEPMVRHVEYAALLRGVGKAGIDQAILNKPGKLTEAEYAEIKKHTTIGHRLLGKVKLLAPAAKMVLHHQEWYNGQGYPEGLKGEAIPLGARIIAVISAWEAMMTDRPYRKALGRQQAMAELERGTGTQFDPAVVAAFKTMET